MSFSVVKNIQKDHQQLNIWILTKNYHQSGQL